MIRIGEHNNLQVSRISTIGLGLVDPEEPEDTEVLLPIKYAPETVKVNDILEVFIYRDSEDRIIATTLKPGITMHNFARLQVKMTTKHGAFLDWGLPKDLFVPFQEQAQRMEQGKWYLVYLFLDPKSDRLAASSRIKRHLNNSILTVQTGDEVALIVIGNSELGVNVIVNQRHRGLIYNNEVFEELKPGDERVGYIKEIRDGNKLDISLQKQGYEAVEPHAQKILTLMEASNGFIRLTDKSDPEAIKNALQMSKKSFKKAVGALYKQKRILLEENGLRLQESQS